MSGFTIETTPAGASKVADFREHLTPGTWVYVTSLPGAPFADMLDTCKRLNSEGMQPVPHFTARSIVDKNALADKLSRMVSEAGVERVLAIAGNNGTVAGDFPDTISMLKTGLFERYGILSIGVAGHPEGSPDFSRELQREHGSLKNAYAQHSDASVYLVTQFTFDAQPVIDWVERIEQQDLAMPVIVGLPGLATVKSLLGYARACGVGPSMAFVKKQARNISRLMAVQAPDRIVRDLADYKARNPNSAIAGVHMFPLGGFAKSASWCKAAARGDIQPTASGFKVT